MKKIKNGEIVIIRGLPGTWQVVGMGPKKLPQYKRRRYIKAPEERNKVGRTPQAYTFSAPRCLWPFDAAAKEYAPGGTYADRSELVTLHSCECVYADFEEAQ